MVNIDKEMINDHIDEAYNGQTEKVKELLEAAKKNLADQKPCPYDYVANKEKASHLYQVSRVISKNKNKEDKRENNINDQFDKMNEKLEINSKNLDFIFKTVSENNKELKSELKLSIEDNVKNSQETTQKILTEEQEKITQKLIKAQLEAENKIIQAQIEAKNKLLASQEETSNKIYEINKISEDKVLDGQKQIKEEVIKGQSKLEETLLNANSSIEHTVLEGQKEIERKIYNKQNILEQKMEQLSKQNEIKLSELKEEIVRMYQKENRYAVNTLLEERNNYLKELEQKDKEKRKLNYKIYAYEEKLEKEMAKRQKNSIFNALFRKETFEEEEPIYTTQILNYIYE